jgi:hypothetical protein
VSGRRRKKKKRMGKKKEEDKKKEERICRMLFSIIKTRGRKKEEYLYVRQKGQSTKQNIRQT